MEDIKLNESKSDKFLRIAEPRINKALKAIESLDALSNKSAYEYTEEQVENMFGALEEKLTLTKQKFLMQKKEKSSFKF